MNKQRCDSKEHWSFTVLHVPRLSGKDSSTCGHHIEHRGQERVDNEELLLPEDRKDSHPRLHEKKALPWIA